MAIDLFMFWLSGAFTTYLSWEGLFFPSIQTFYQIFYQQNFNSFYYLLRITYILFKNKLNLMQTQSYEEDLRNQNSSKAESRGAGVTFSFSHWVIVLPPCSMAFSMSHNGRLNPEGCTAALRWNSWCTDSLCENCWLLLRCLLLAGFLNEYVWRTWRWEIIYFLGLISPLYEVQMSLMYHSWTPVTPCQPSSSWLESSKKQLSCHYLSLRHGWLCGFSFHS